MLSKMIKKLSLIIFLTFLFSLLSGFLPKDTQAMLLREKSLRESFFTKLIDEISLAPKQHLSQSIRLNYDAPLGIEILFRNPSEQKAEGLLRLRNDKLTLIEKEFFLESKSPAGFYFFAFPELKNAKGGEFWVEVTNLGSIPLTVGYYNQNVYHYGDLYLGKALQAGVLQFQIHYQINPLQKLSANLRAYLQKGWLFFSIWLVIIISMTVLVIIFGKNYRLKERKRDEPAQRKD